MKHEHTECEHKEVKHCKKCDVVYCFSCTKEWSVNNFGTITFSSSDPMYLNGTYNTSGTHTRHQG